MFKNKLYIYNILTILYVVCFSVWIFETELSTDIGQYLLYLLWVVIPDDKEMIGLFIYTPLIPFCIQMYFKIRQKGFKHHTYIMLSINLILMFVISYLIFYCIFFGFYHAGEV